MLSGSVADRLGKVAPRRLTRSTAAFVAVAFALVTLVSLASSHGAAPLLVQSQVSGRDLLARLTRCDSARGSFDNPRRSSPATNLVSHNGPEGTAARLNFGQRVDKNARGGRHNPNILPYPHPEKALAPYLAFARQTTKRDVFDHEVVHCEMEFAYSPVIGRRIMRCVKGKPKPDQIRLPMEWANAMGTCKNVPMLRLKQGILDPRVFYSPWGEPLMIFGSNGWTTCLSLFIIDLRVLIPGLEHKVDGGEVRFNEVAELPRAGRRDVEKNWFIIWDEHNHEYIHYDFADRAIAPLSGPTAGQDILKIYPYAVQGATPQCLLDLTKTAGKSADTHLHQATNSLRVTLCAYPCEPTLQNTVLVTIVHVKYHHGAEVFYRRHAVVMNATVPFTILGHTSNLMFPGVDEKSLVYTVSMAWDPNFIDRSQPPPPPEDDTAFTVHPARHSVHHLGGEDDPFIDRRRSLRDAPQNKQIDMPGADILAPARPHPQMHTSNPLADDGNYYHGWIDQMVMLSLGINDLESAVVHVPMRDILSCLITC